MYVHIYIYIIIDIYILYTYLHIYIYTATPPTPVFFFWLLNLSLAPAAWTGIVARGHDNPSVHSFSYYFFTYQRVQWPQLYTRMPQSRKVVLPSRRRCIHILLWTLPKGPHIMHRLQSRDTGVPSRPRYITYHASTGRFGALGLRTF